MAARAAAFDIGGAQELVVTEQNPGQWESLLAAPELVGVSVDLRGTVLWEGTARDELVLQTASRTVRVKINLNSHPALVPGQLVRVTGCGMAGQGRLDDAVVDNDGLHPVTEKSGSIYLKAGWHPLRADWFNGRADYAFSVDYAGPQMDRRAIPEAMLCRQMPASNGPASSGLPGLEYKCYEGSWEWLPHWEDYIPVRAGTVTNFDLRVRSRDQLVGLEFSGYLRVEQEGAYTFWTRSDDGSRLFIGDAPLRLEVLGLTPLPAPRLIVPGEALEPGADYFWATAEGTVSALHYDPYGRVQLELSSGAGRMNLEFERGKVRPPVPFSQIRATGLCRSTPFAGQGPVAGRLLVCSGGQIEELAPAPLAAGPWALTVEQLRRMATNGQPTGCALRLTGTVVAASSRPGFFAFEDPSGGVLVQTEESGSQVVPGQRVVLSGTGILEGNRLSLRSVPVVDNNGIHARQEKTGVMWLRAGKHSIHVSWFNRLNPPSLEVYYQGPGLPQCRIPTSALMRPTFRSGDGEMRWLQGLSYQCFEGDWQTAPALSGLDPLAIGVCSNFNPAVASRAEKAGVEFSGYLDVPRDGQYFFNLASADGSLLFVDEQTPRIERLGVSPLPAAVPIAPHQIIPPEQDNRWAEVEGKVSFAYERAGALFLELSSGYGAMSVEVVDGQGTSPLLLLGGRVRVAGFCQSALMPSGREVAATLVTLGREQIQLLEPSPSAWSRYPLTPIREIGSRTLSPTEEVVFYVRGEAGAGPTGRRMKLADDSGSITVDSAQAVPANLCGQVEVIGRLVRLKTNAVLQGAIYRPMTNQPDWNLTELPLLTTVRQVKQLSREQAQRGYPVKIRGVLTLVRGSGTGFIIQDDTSAIDVWWQPGLTNSGPRIGDYWEVEGETFLEFAPNVRARRAVRLGTGIMPEPLRPTWDQLINGSLDTQYVELQGIVTASDSEAIILLTRTGRIRVLLSNTPVEVMRRYENALVRIRGCVVPIRDRFSQQVQVGQIRLSNVSLNVDEPAPADPFSIGRKLAFELLQFDARAGSLQRVRIVGQVLHARNGELFLLDATNAVRVLPRSFISLRPGDLVEAVGFPELGSGAPVLRESAVRRLGSAGLPTPIKVSEDALVDKGLDGSRVSVQARLLGVGAGPGEQVLELQSGKREFVARVAGASPALRELSPGSLLELTGVYALEAAGSASQEQLGSFALLLHGPDAVKVLELPPWWTLQRALLFAGGLALLIVAALCWIVLLRRRVEERSAQLALEVSRREHVQQQNALERERSRIAKDMHDQLGTSVTQVGLLAERTKRDAASAEQTLVHAEKICQMAFELGRTLDEIVWAVNPKNDSLDKFCDYMAVQAQEFFQLTNVLCRVDLPPELPGYPLSAELRHNLFLATKEALNNVVRHAQAREVWVRFKLQEGRFQISIMDDGRGFEPGPKTSLRNGLSNMRKRLEDAGGTFAIHKVRNHGTEVIFSIGLKPLAAPAAGE